MQTTKYDIYIVVFEGVFEKTISVEAIQSLMTYRPAILCRTGYTFFELKRWKKITDEKPKDDSGYYPNYKIETLDGVFVTTFDGFYRMSDLNGKDGQKMKRQVVEDLLNGKALTDSRILSAEFFLGSYGFSMRVTNDGKFMAITVYDSKTIASATDGGKKKLNDLMPIDGKTAATYQRYFWVIPINKVIEAYKDSIIRSYKQQ